MDDVISRPFRRESGTVRRAERRCVRCVTSAVSPCMTTSSAEMRRERRDVSVCSTW